MTARITLLTRPGCHLCDEARAVVSKVAQDTGTGWVEQNIDDDAELTERYTDEVPVVLVDGAQHAFWRVDEQRLRQALQRRRSWLRR